MNHLTSIIQSSNNIIRDPRRLRKVLADISPRIRKRNPPKTEERRTTRLKKSKAS